MTTWLRGLLADGFLHVPERLRLERVNSYLDGGTVDIVGVDPQGRRRRVRLVQRMFGEASRLGRPGRLYLGWRRVPRGGRAEAAILELAARLLAEQESAGPEAGELVALYRVRVYSLRRLLSDARRGPPSKDELR